MQIMSVRGLLRNLLVVSILLSFFCPAAALCAGDMNTPVYWIERLPAPDAVVLSPAEIDGLNSRIILRIDQMAEIDKMPDVIPADKLREWLLFDPAPDLAVVDRYNAKGARLSKKNADALTLNANIDAVAAFNPVRFGRVFIRADIRGFPADNAVLRRPGEVSFDTLQYSSIYPPTPVALVHKSKDGKWGFFQTPFTRGWMRLDKVAFSSREDVVAHSTEPLVITGSSVAVYEDAGLKKLRIELPMGTILDIVWEEAEAWHVRLPARASGSNELIWTVAFVDKKADAHKGFLPYTPQTIITQAFKMLGDQYGWGGLGGRRDCSEFMRNTFATVGVRLPRNSQQQLQAGIIMPGDGAAFTPETLKAALSDSQARQGITFLVTPTHIMLYLGKDAAGSPYVIHQTHGYTRNGTRHIVDRVVVSGLGYKEDKAGLWPLLGQVKTVTVVALPVAPAPAKAVAAADGVRIDGL